jgi:hypothetical protein
MEKRNYKLRVVGKAMKGDVFECIIDVICNIDGEEKHCRVTSVVKKVNGRNIVSIVKGCNEVFITTWEPDKVCKEISAITWNCYYDSKRTKDREKPKNNYKKVIKDVLVKLDELKVLGCKVETVKSEIKNVKLSNGKIVEPDSVIPLVLVTFTDGVTYLTTCSNFFGVIEEEVNNVIDESNLDNNEKEFLKDFFNSLTFKYIKIEDEDLEPIRTFKPMDYITVKIYMDKTKISIYEKKEKDYESIEIRRCKINTDELAKELLIKLEEILEEESY